MLDLATLWNRSKRFMDSAVEDLYDGDDGWHVGGGGSCLVKEEVVEKAFDVAIEATKRSAVWKCIVLIGNVVVDIMVCFGCCLVMISSVSS